MKFIYSFFLNRALGNKVHNIIIHNTAHNTVLLLNCLAQSKIYITEKQPYNEDYLHKKSNIANNNPAAKSDTVLSHQNPNQEN